MLTNRLNRTASCVALSLVVVAFAGCRKETAETSPAPAAPAASTATDDPAVEAILAKADLVDGKADHIVSKCAGCQLGMDGDRAHAMKTNGYKLLFCSADCKDAFTKDTDASILALVVPEN